MNDFIMSESETQTFQKKKLTVYAVCNYYTGMPVELFSDRKKAEEFRHSKNVKLGSNIDYYIKEMEVRY